MEYQIFIKTNQKIQLNEFVKYLIKFGYQYNSYIDSEGVFSVKGGNVSIWPYKSDSFYRIEFYGDKIFSIRQFIWPSFRFIKKVKKLKILNLKFLSRYKSLDFTFIFDLKPGDLVVHQDHGIGIFKGLVKKDILGLSKEYILIQYQGSDRLYVPLELSDKIQKYIGPKNPKISRFSREKWWIIKKRIKKETEEIAKKILEANAKRETITSSPNLIEYTKEEKEVIKRFNFSETQDQEFVIEEIYKKLKKRKPFEVLICGDVGFGKTEVALRAALRVIINNGQVLFLTPTTILSQQHYDNFKQRFSGLPFKVAVLNRIISKLEKYKLLEELSLGKIDILITTHKIFFEDIKFKNLKLIIIDEEQKFGVEKKESLKEEYPKAHYILLSATPIPRTLYLALNQIKDIYTIKTPPVNRKPIKTNICEYDEELIKQAVKFEIDRDGQVYYLFNKVEQMELKKNELKKILGEKIRIGILHGKLKKTEIIEVMSKFDNKKLDLLICSTIIENGLDLPNVNTLIVENSHKFGLAQLHQIRGRIGRSDIQAYAYFFYPKNLKIQNLKPRERKRLLYLKEYSELGSGFEIAMKDMEIRGIGDILGTRQHGFVKTVGLLTYLELLQESIMELKGKDIKPQFTVDINIPIEYRIPENIISDVKERVRIYHSLAKLKDLRDLKLAKINFLNQYKVKRKDLEYIENLFFILALKIKAKKLGIYEINITTQKDIYGEIKNWLIMKLDIRKFDFKKLIDEFKNFYILEQGIRVEINTELKDFINKVFEFLKMCYNK